MVTQALAHGLGLTPKALTTRGGPRALGRGERMKLTKLSLLFIVLWTSIIPGHEAVAADTGTKTIGNIVSSTSWLNFTVIRLGTSDNSRATTGSNDTSNAVVVTTWYHAFPPARRLHGIEVQVEGE